MKIYQTNENNKTRFYQKDNTSFGVDILDRAEYTSEIFSKRNSL